MATEASSDWSTPVKFTVAGENWPSIEYGKLLASDGAAGDSFCIVSLNAAGDLALIGALYDDDKGEGSGSVYVFTRSGTVWTQQQKFYSSDAAAGDYFGSSCALNAAGDLALIGAYADNDKGTDSGSVYVFTRSGATWTQQQKLLASDGAAGDWFGVSCALNTDGTIALIGAISVDLEGKIQVGATYYFSRSDTVWTQRQKIYPSVRTEGSEFASSVALNAVGDLALIGSRGDFVNGTKSGSVYVFTRSGNVWTEQQKLLASDGSDGDGFGQSAALNATGDIALIGSAWSDDKGLRAGSVYVFTRSGSTWTQQQKLLASDGVSGDDFGISCALNADGAIALIGSHLDDDKGTDSGSVYVFS